ncbi:MAG: TerB family tellurite resistance protein [Alphaproteobacteria bacterium]|nr:TerB family tellurite resistance protein [Alphaproteobacteria bacterium]
MRSSPAISIFDQLRKLLAAPEAEPPKPDDLHVAVAVLLVEAATMDAEFNPAERSVIEHLLAGKFHLPADKAHQLVGIAEATVKHSAQIHPFTRLTVARMDRQQRIRLIEMLWEVAYADGVLDPEEDSLLRRVAGLIYVSDADRVAARQSVLARFAKKH